MGAISFLATKAESLHVFKQNIRCPIYINKNNKSPCGTYNETAYPFPTT